MLLRAREEFNEWLSRYGRSTCDGIMREHFKKRIPDDRPARIKVSASARRDMYARQSGKCGICGKDMDGGNLTRLDVDHIDPSLTGSAFNHRSNLALCHPSCNRSKGAKSLAEVAKANGRTVRDMMTYSEQGDDEEIEDGGMWPTEKPEPSDPPEPTDRECEAAARDYEAYRHRG